MCFNVFLNTKTKGGHRAYSAALENKQMIAASLKGGLGARQRRGSGFPTRFSQLRVPRLDGGLAKIP